MRPSPQQPQDAGADGGNEPGDVKVGRRRGRVEAQRAVGGFREHAVEEQGVAVHVDLEPNRWSTVTDPDWPSAHPARRARRRYQPSTACTNTAMTARQSAWSKARR